MNEADSTTFEPLALTDLPAVGEPLRGGLFAGIGTIKCAHVAIVMLQDRIPVPKGLSWKRALAWAESLQAQLPSAAIAVQLTHIPSLPKPRHCWTEDPYDTLRAKHVDFATGALGFSGIAAEYNAVAVRLVPLFGAATEVEVERRVRALESRLVAQNLADRIRALEALLPKA